MDLTKDMGVIETLGKLSPPLLMVLVINALLLATQKFIHRKYELILCIGLGVVLYPSLIPVTTLIYSFPNPMAALVCYGIVAGFAAWLLQSKVNAMLSKFSGRKINGHNDTITFTKADVGLPTESPSTTDQPKSDKPTP